MKNLEDGRINDGLLQKGCRTRQSKLVDELLLLPEGGGVSHSKWVECLQLLLLRECDGVRDCKLVEWKQLLLQVDSGVHRGKLVEWE